MSDIVLAPPVAFVVYLALVGALAAAGRLLAGPAHPSALKASVYASGEAPPARPAAPGYRPFFAVALFFAIVHLGVLVLASSGLTPLAGVYLAGLLLVLVALMLG